MPDVSTADLVRATGLHENTVRGHLERLREDGYIRRFRDEAAGRGRPAWRWRAVEPAGLSAYAGLAATLASALGQAASSPSAAARSAGVTWGARLVADRSAAHEGGRSPVAAARALVVDVMREQGFGPEVDSASVRLHSCPLLAAAADNTAIVCAAHEGMVEGIARANGADLESSLTPFAADGACVLRLSVPA